MSRPRPPHPDAAQQAITTELVRLSLGGQPERFELQGRVTDPEEARRVRRLRKGVRRGQ